jgi:purine nucleosidase
MRNFLIDTDTASDDAVAIMMALAEPSVRVLGLTTVAGNVELKQATRNALLTGEICKSDVPVFAGADKPLTRAHDHAHWFHGKDGLGDRGYPAPKRKVEREPAVEAILRLAQAEPGLTLVTLGPLTNIALALERDPKLAERIGRCVVMGGAPCCEGNVTPAAEYNIWVDPEAARAVFRSKLKIEMVGWHVSRGPSVLRDDEIAAIEATGTGKAKFAIECNGAAREGYRVQTGEIGLSLADPTAMAVALDRSIGLSWSRHRVAIECDSALTRGMTVVDRLNVSADENNAQVWNAAAGESDGADILWTLAGSRLCSELRWRPEGKAEDLKWNPAAISLARRRRPIFCSTPRTRCIGAHGAPKLWRRPSGATAQFSCRSAMPLVTGAT